MSADILFDNDTGFEIDVRVRRLPSTAQTRERYEFLRKKRIGATWEEDGCLYVKGQHGVTAFRVSAQSSSEDRQDEEVRIMAERLMSQIREWNQRKDEEPE
jgi:hypothetical protein